MKQFNHQSNNAESITEKQYVQHHTFKLTSKSLTLLFIGLTTTIVALAVACIVLLMVNTMKPSLIPQISSRKNRSVSLATTTPVWGEPHQLITQTQWNGQRNTSNSQVHDLLTHPTNLVIISHSASQFCTTTQECSWAVLHIQNYHTNMGLSNVYYNFLIGGDGNVYVGRGWDVRNTLRLDNIMICFLGNYVHDQLTEGMIEAAWMLLRTGVALRKLSADYKVVCHNQTFNTISPGRNVYRVVKKWPHFSADKLY